MVERKVYESKDGKLFNNAGDCRIYERSLSVNSAIVVIRNFCNQYDCTKCPFYKDSEIFEEKRCMFLEKKPPEWETI